MKPKDWIRIEDKKPRCGQRVLVCQAYGDQQKFVRIATSVTSEWRGYREWYDDEGFPIEDVTHWMPIVPPSKKK